MTIRYISGPMRSKPGYNYQAFASVEQALLLAFPGDNVLNPADNFAGDTTRPVEDYMRADINMILGADEIVLLPGWEASEGAKLEVRVAKSINCKFLRAVETNDAWEWDFVPFDPGDDNANVSPRASALNEAKDLICGDRNAQYGPPTEDFRRTAAMASAFGFRVVSFEGATPTALSAYHVAVFMMLLKTSRLAWSPEKRDSWVDTAGYAGCGYECAVEEAA